MLIDWFTVAAQTLNFLILVWLLQHFLYKPILTAIDAREKAIAAEFAGADAKSKEADAERTGFQNKNKVFDDQRAALFAKAADDAKTERENLLAQAHQDADGFRASQDVALQTDRARLSKEITRLAKDEVFNIARRTLADLATVSLEASMADIFTRRLRTMDGAARQALGAALRPSSQSPIVRSAFDLPPDQQAAIRNAVNETFSADIPIRFETAPDEVCGIELTANGQKIAWSIADYLSSLDQKVDAFLDSQATPTSAPPLVARAGAA